MNTSLVKNGMFILFVQSLLQSCRCKKQTRLTSCSSSVVHLLLVLTILCNHRWCLVVNFLTRTYRISLSYWRSFPSLSCLGLWLSWNRINFQSHPKSSSLENRQTSHHCLYFTPNYMLKVSRTILFCHHRDACSWTQWSTDIHGLRDYFGRSGLKMFEKVVSKKKDAER
jgi:hypothetical protein